LGGRTNHKLLQRALRDTVIFDKQIKVVVWILRLKLIVRVIRIPPQHATDGIAHGKTGDAKIVAGETDYTVEWYRPDRAVGLIHRDVEIQRAGSLRKAACLTL